MSEEMNSLTMTRGRLKGSITRALAFAQVPSAETTFDDVVSRLERLEEVWQAFVKLTDDLYKFKDVENFADPEADFASYEEKYLSARGKLYALKSQYAPTLNESTANSGAIAKLADQQAAFLEKLSTTSHPKENDLPRINIPFFTGTYKDWPSFKDLFESAIGSKRISNIQKFHYLKSLLKEDAARLIQHIPVTETAFQTTWTRLNDRYDRPKQIVTSFIEAFMALPSISTENAATMRKISDGANEIIRGLDAIGKDERDWWLIYLLLSKLDPESKSKWIRESRDNPLPTINDFFEFLDNRCEEVELCAKKQAHQSKHSHSGKSQGNHTKCLVSTKAKPSCLLCKSPDHSIFTCPTFLQKDINERRHFVKESALCYNCLRQGHAVSNCASKGRCKQCHRRHHSLLHLPSNEHEPTYLPGQVSESSPPESPSSSNNTASANIQWSTTANVACPISLPSLPSSSKHCTSDKEFIMPTASIYVKDRFGKFITCRALLDTASKLSFITESCAQRLGLQRYPSKIIVNGISSIKAETTRGLCQIFVRSRISEQSINAKVHVLPKITTSLPGYSFENKIKNQLMDLPLADPTYNISSQIDILFGLEHIWNIFTFNKRIDSQGNTIAISTIFGWVVTCAETEQIYNQTTTLVTTVDIDRCLRSFWELEETEHHTKADPDNIFVETHFQTTHSRASDGKYVVQLPFKNENPIFGNTLNGALSRFYAVERRLQRNPAIRDKYIGFMRDYEKLGHMRKLKPHEINVTDGRVFYLPHHPVLGEKIRVVFDGSFQDSNGISLNNNLHIGPSIQRDLFAVCLRFRFHRYVFSADIVKMFRQIWISEHHKNYQRIVWRESPLHEVQHYILCTVTYGTSCAPYLSVRVLEQLAYDYKSKFPIASKVVMEDFYVDDVITGAQTEEEIVFIRDNLVNLLAQAGLELRKWVSNCVSISDSTQDQLFFAAPEKDVKKVLGIFWRPSSDQLGYHIELNKNPVATKRQVLSDVSRIFDPMGLLSPVVIQFKILLRELWSHKLSWDEPLPENLTRQWTTFRQDLISIQDFTLPRYILNDVTKLELHGFSDASIHAYSAAVYCRFVDDTGHTHVKLIAAKTRVAPIKQKSLPCLELCGALILSRLLKRIKEALPHKSIDIRAWCDSTIVLCWLSQPPIKLKTFEANRTSEILEILPHPDALSAFKLSSKVLVSTVNDYNPLHELVHRISKWNKLIRVVAYIFKFINATRYPHQIKSPNISFNNFKHAELILTKYAQDAFSEERTLLQSKRLVSTTSSLAKLHPFIDGSGLLRVGGRLRNSELDNASKYPIILPKCSRITKLILQNLHEKNLHPGVSALFVIARQTYWIIGARNLIRNLTHNCLKCFRQRQINTQQLMADLPSIRVRQAFPFENTGCDYAGPIILKQYSGRNAKKSKGYICLFVCLVTSAIHLELATDLSTDCFIAALKRFISRRGKCKKIFSDNGRNFLGASRELNEMHKVILSQTHNEIVSASLAEDGIQWTFIPPFAPHWGGMWESAVRSVKLHLKRVIGNTELTFEQMHTLLAQVEAVVNSRPLGTVPDTDCEYLSPAHFLIGRPYTTVPEGDLVNLTPNRLGYWQHVQNMFQGFWRRWHQEYLTSLQQRPKWNRPQPNLAVGDVVVVKEKNLPPSKFLLAKVIETYPGIDGNVRAVKLKTQCGEMTRPISTLVKLPII
ncbi:uncharacterized protein LOC142228991 [Haematobia irritans]|uniref:uncharacterized protein LOC142228991 n=1 Tax=Haematobia irritans TaxID=7368 RepID=UPI003F503A29